jgi:putative membrane protein
MPDENINQNIPKSSRITEHLANERTFLAWIRTSIGIMAFGFVVEKFEIFIKQIRFLLLRSTLPDHTLTSKAFYEHTFSFGAILLAFGVLIAVLAFIQYKVNERQIQEDIYQPTIWLNTLLVGCVVAIGVVLGLYLRVSI